MAESSKRSAEFCTDATCFVCTVHIKDPKKNFRTNISLSTACVADVKKQYTLWKKKANIPSKVATAISVLDEVFEERNLDSITLKWHLKCRPSFMLCLERHPDIQPVEVPEQADVDESTPPPTATPKTPKTMYLRSQASLKPYNKDIQCVVCLGGEEKGKLNLVLTKNVHMKLQEVAEHNIDVMVRLQSAFDAMAGDVKYHSVCAYFNKNDEGETTQGSEATNINDVFLRLSNEINARLSRGQVVLMSVCYEQFTSLCMRNPEKLTTLINKDLFLTQRSLAMLKS